MKAIVTEFDDPTLQKAVRACWVDEACPDALRRRIESMCVRPAGRSRWMIYSIVTGLAAAAAVTLILRPRNFEPVRPSLASVPVSLQSALVKTHDYCCQMSDHQRVIAPRNDGAAIARAMTAELHRSVLASGPAGWKFRGAALCPVGAERSGHLVYTSGAEAISVFSLPMSAMPDAADGSEFETTVDGHPIVGFVRDGAVFVLVGSGVSAPNLESLRGTLEARVTVADAADSTPVLAMELMRPIGP